MDFTVRTTNVQFLNVVRRYLGAFRTEEGPRDILFSADCGVEKQLVGGTTVRGKMRLYFQGILCFQGNYMEEMAGRLISATRDWTNNQSNEFLRIRAGGVGIDGGTLLLPSPPEAHLATVVSLLVSKGAGYVGDEIVNIDPVLRRAHGTGLPLLLTPQDLVMVPGLPQTGWKPRRGRDLQARTYWPVLLEDLQGGQAGASEVKWIVFPTFKLGSETELRDIGKAEALFRFTQAGLNLHIWMERAFVLMQELLASAFVAEVVIGDLSEGAAFLLASLPERT